MNGKTQAYLDLAARPAVGAVLLDPRPAFVFRADGSGLLWANAAGVAFFGEAGMGALLDRRLAPASRTARDLARLAKSLPADRPRLELLRFNFGVRQEALAAACSRIDLGAGARAVLAVATGGPPRESLSTRAERLADAIASDDCLVAVLDRDGRVLGASGGFDALGPASAEIDALVESAASADRPVVRTALAVDGGTRPAGVARITVGEERLHLLIVGPVEPAMPHAAAEPSVAPAPQTHAVETAAAEPPSPASAGLAAVAAEAPPAPSPDAPTPGPAPLRFLWQTDAGNAFIFVSPALAGAVGTAHAPEPGVSWRALAERLALDPDGDLASALSGLAGFAGLTVWWPLADRAERVAVDLTAVPVFGGDGVFAGYRGFGLIRSGDRRPDEPAVAPPAEEAAPVGAPPPPVPPGQEPALASEPPARANDIDDAARASVEGNAPAEEVAPPAESVPATPVEASATVVPLGNTPSRILPRRLTGTERDAFRRIAEALGVETRAEEAARAAPDETPPPGPKPADFDTALLDRLPVAIVVYRESRTLFANRTLLDLLGYDSFRDFASAGGAEAIFPDTADWSARPLAGSRLRAARRGGGDIAVDAKLHAVPWVGNTALMLSLLPAAEEPREPASGEAGSEARLRELEAILDTATDGVVVIDGTGTVDGMNRAAEALFGVEADEVAGRPFTDLLAEESRKAALDYLDGLASNGVASVLNDGREVIGRVPRGGLIPLFMTMGRLAESGKYCAVLRDITHWKNVEEELVAARKAAETANAQKSEFLARISHEIRTPLNAILGFSEVMMAERFGPISNERYRSYLRDIHLSGEHLMSLINDLLDLSKVEAGKLDLNFESVPVNEVIQECVALMQPQANRERIIIRTSLASGVPNVVADMRSLRQILLNLLSNAVKFTRAGGQVIVATALEDSGEVVVRIRDTGIGMSAKDIETAMKPFRQVATSGRMGEGTGLGLPLTKALVEANRAAFALDSVPDQGTLVRITFPTTRVLAG